MRRKPMRPGLLALILAVIYLAGMTAGIWFIGYLPSGAKRPGMSYMIQTMADQYAEQATVDPSSLGGRLVLVYAADGQQIDSFQTPGRAIHFDFEARAQRYLPAILKGEEPIRLVYLAKDDTTLGYTSLVYVGAPIAEGGEITGALIWVRELQDLLESILAFMGIFTVAFAVLTLVMIGNLRSQRRYDQMRRQYIDNITHELKTPVASIKALAEALSDGMDKNSNDRSVYYGMILREANRQERMVCDVLELSKLQSYRVHMAKKPVSAADVFGPTLEKYASLCDLIGVSFTVSDTIRDLPRLMTDEKYIQTVLDALLSNALKFVSEGGSIRVEGQVGHRHATICVADDGKGISKEDLPHVFERFYKSSSANETGSGLGLAIAREIMDNLKEKLWLKSKQGEGTQAFFTVTLATPRSFRPD